MKMTKPQIMKDLHFYQKCCLAEKVEPSFVYQLKVTVAIVTHVLIDAQYRIMDLL